MARKPMITRTILSTKVNVLCLNVVSGEPFNKDVVIPRTFKDNNKLFKCVETVINTDEVKAVHITHTEVEENLYGMTEQEFIEKAEKLPPRKITKD